MSFKAMEDVRQVATSNRWTVSTCRVNSEASARELGYAFETALFSAPKPDGSRDFIEVLERYPDESTAREGHQAWFRRLRESGYSTPPAPAAAPDGGDDVE